MFPRKKKIMNGKRYQSFTLHHIFKKFRKIFCLRGEPLSETHSLQHKRQRETRADMKIYIY